MRIYELLFRNSEPIEGNLSDSYLDSAQVPSCGLFTKLANAYRTDRFVKRFWGQKGLEGHPARPPPPDAGTELIPTGALEPSTPSMRTGAVEEQSPVGLRHLIPVRRHRVY
jgi:hypothetical protein